MKSVGQFLSDLRSKDIRIWVEETGLRFDAPKGAFTREIRDELVARKPEIIAFLKRAKAPEQSGEAPIPKAPRDQPPPLSYPQQRLWLLHEIEEDNRGYNMPAAFRLKGVLEPRLLVETFAIIMARHESLRTNFKLLDGTPVQIIQPALPSPLRHVDLAGLAREERKQMMQILADREVRHSFDLASHCLLRVLLLRLGPEDHGLVFTVHHIISDGWSRGILVREFISIYGALREGKEPDLPPLPIQYADFACWQRQNVTQEVLEKQLSFWKETLAGAPPLLDLPLDRPRPIAQTFRGHHQTFHLAGEDVARLKQLAQSNGATLFMVLQKVFALLLSRYSSQRDVLVGSPLANRTRRELEPLIGVFINTLVFRHRFTQPAQTFLQSLAKFRETALAAYANQDVPFELVVDVVQPGRDLSYNPIFQVMFILQNASRDTVTLPGLEIGPLSTAHTVSRFDLTLSMEDHDHELRGSLEYNTDLFDGTTAEHLVHHYRNLLTQVARAPQSALSAYSLIDERERNQVLHQWNRTEAPYPKQCLHALIMATARRVPHKTAITFGRRDYSYAELVGQASRLAGMLQQRGVGPEDFVGLYLERSHHLLVAMLAVLQSGGAYLPLDPAFPQERIDCMMGHARPRLIISQTELLPRLDFEPEGVIDVLNLSEEALVPLRPVDPAPENTAYVLYTSGSTGKPKGVVVSHGALVNFLTSMAEKPGLSEQDRLLAVTTVSFDIAGLELYLPLLQGGSILMASKEDCADGRRLARLLMSAQVTVMQATPAGWRLLENAGWTGRRGLTLLCGGEALTGQQAATLLNKGAALWNLYGPTETTIWSATRRITEAASGVETLGRPIANTQLYVLDRASAPCPIGLPGHLFIGGHGLARGYLHQPGLTAERFLPNPHGIPGSRMYWTGDLARYRWDGDLQFLGRDDGQVKVRGFRIELGEIEHVLARCSELAMAAVTVSGESDEAELVAYYVSHAHRTSDNAPARIEADSGLLDILRAHLHHCLPAYMVPSRWVAMNDFPLTPNGKLDRGRLPRVDQARRSALFTAPVTATEKQLALLFGEVLDVEKVGLEDNFFDLGGHSLRGMQLFSRIREVFEIEIPLGLLFRHATVRRLAEFLETRADTHAAVPPIPALPRKRAVTQSGSFDSLAQMWKMDECDCFPLSYDQERLWLLNRLTPLSADYNMPLSFAMEGALEEALVGKAFEILMARHESLRTWFREIDGTPLQIVAPCGLLSYEIQDLTELPADSWDQQIQAVANEDAARCFELDKGPLWRATLLRLSDSYRVFILNMHHIISDGWSLGVMVREFLAIYKALCQGEVPELAPLPIQYGDYAAWQRDWLEGEVLERKTAYWSDRLEDAPVRIDLVTDFPRPARPSTRGERRSFRVSAQTTERLRALAAGVNGSLFMPLLAALVATLQRMTGQSDLVLGTAVAGRTHREMEALIGFFVNSLVLRFNLRAMAAGTPHNLLSFAGLLEETRDIVLGALSNGDMPFNLLVKKLRPERLSTNNPMFNVMFALQNTPREDLILPGVSFRSLALMRENARFDMFLSLTEMEDGSLHGSWEYATDLFERTTIDRAMGLFQVCLEQCCETPEMDINRYPLMDEADRRELLQLAETHADEPPLQKSMGEVFEEVVSRRPDGRALVFGDHCLTYAALNQRADSLATRLRPYLTPGRPVAVCMARSAQMVTAVLAVIKAGSPYVGIDPKSPATRIALILGNADVALVVHDSSWDQDLPEGDYHLVDLDQTKESQPEALPGKTRVHPSQLAYISYTSGSTGVPKGVCITHEAVLRLVHKPCYAILDQDRIILQYAPLAFDASTFEVWGCLLNGGCLVVAPAHASMGDLGRTIRTHHINTLWLTATLFHLMVDYHPEDLQGVTQLLAGGEALSVNHVARARTILAEGTLINGYGPTETTTFACTYAVREDVAHWKSIPIGRPINHTQVYITDPFLDLVPRYIPGELLIGGKGLARGYLADPRRTALRFVPDPFSREPGRRLYRSGDLTRMLGGGLIQFLNRIDEQVKIRGFRIEPGEIEAVLEQIADKALVLVWETDQGDKQLVAYATFPSEAGGEGAADQAGSAEQVDTWQMVFDQQVYSDFEDYEDPTLNLSGWHSSYDGSHIPHPEMIVWVEDTVGKIRSLSPQHVLELGCGTGLLLFRVAPACRSYTGCDISQNALAHVRAHADRPELRDVEIHLYSRSAEDFSGLNGDYDLVLLNSVGQYFPSIDYMDLVIQASIGAVGTRGSLFFGDIRNFTTLKDLRTDIEWLRSSKDMDPDTLRHLIAESLEDEGELTLDPAYFLNLVHRFPQVTHVEILYKRGEVHNELTCFRYDARIHVGQSQEIRPQWQPYTDFASVRQALESGLDHLAVKGVPNARLVCRRALADRLDEDTTLQNLSELADWLDQNVHSGVDPHACWQLGDALGYETRIMYAGVDRDTLFDLAFIKKAAGNPLSGVPMTHSFLFTADHGTTDLKHLANNPMKGKLRRRYLPVAREHLKKNLPEYMVPDHLLLVEEFPLTSSGKIDRRSLPHPLKPGRVQRERQAARTSTEQLLLGIWSRILGIATMGTNDNFFELGGHSLLATQVISSIKQVFQVELPLRRLFDSPTIGELALAVDGAGLEKENLGVPPLEPRTGDALIPLSYAQQRLWFLDQLEPDNPFYNTPIALMVEGDLQVSSLNAAIQMVVDRHESLRTTISRAGDVPCQIIHETHPLSLPLTDLSYLDDETREEELARHILMEGSRPFRLSHSLYRFHLYRLAPRRHALMLTMHHIVTDAWSLGVLIREMSLFYNAQVKGHPPALPALTIQYPDFAVWQRGWLAGDALQKRLDYWRRRLSAPLPITDIPRDFPRPPRRSYRGEELKFLIPTTIVDRMRHISVEKGGTLFMTLLAGFKVLLYHYTGQSDVIVGTSIANRNRIETEPLIGFFVNSLALRTDLSGCPTFDTLIERVRETTLDAYMHQDVPFETVVDAVLPERDLSRHPIFQILISMINTETSEKRAEPADLKLSPIPSHNRVAKFDITINMVEYPSGIGLNWEYCTDLFRRETMVRMAQHFRNLLAAVAEHGRLPIDRIPIMAEKERHQLLVTWNDTDLARTPQLLLASFECNAASTPHQTALVLGEAEMTYAQLDAQANHLAAFLREGGIGPGVFTGICLARSFEMMIAIYGVLKAGGAYVPVDPEYPKDRLAFMLEDARVPLLLTHSEFAPVLPDGPFETCYMDRIPQPADGAAAAAVPKLRHVDHPAYMIYTSGSTGRPKGVMISHRAIHNRLAWMQEYFQLGRDESVLQKTPIGFDVSVWELFWPLAGGARLVLAEPGGHKDPRYLAGLIARREITTLHFVPSMLEAFLPEAEARDLPSLTRVICSGEALAPSLCMRFYRSMSATLTNLYGPTEAAVDVTAWTCRADSEESVVPIGRPISNIRIYITDPTRRPVPAGVSGELCIGGVGLALGYHRRPALTGKTFIPDPFGMDKGGRLYLTGDLVRHRSDGALEFLGRIDFQVKLRGFRIELGEIESCLRALDEVEEAAVLLRADSPNPPQLVAYVRPTPSHEVDSARLRAELGARLPDYMVPSVIMVLKQFPLTPNGKLNRRALPAPLLGRIAPSQRVLPRDRTEIELAEIWCEVLNLSEVGVTESFFHLGGHSLLAVQIFARLRSRLDVDLPLATIFSANTIALLAGEVARQRLEGTAPDQPVTAMDRSEKPPLSFAQTRLWFLHQLEGNRDGTSRANYNMPLALCFRGGLDRQRLEQSIQQMVDHHEILRTSFLGGEGGPYQKIHPPFRIALVLMDLRDHENPREEAKAQASLLARTAFRLEEVPLFSVSLLRTADDEHILVLVLHHILADGWSLGILGEELAVFYRMAGEDGLSQPAPLSLHYADYATWQRRLLTDQHRDRQLTYWLKRLDGIPAALNLPTDQPRPPVFSYRGGCRSFSIPSATVDQLQQVCLANGVTMFMALQAVWAILLLRYSGQNDFCVGVPISTRTRPELESMIGFFTNTLVFRFTIAEGGDGPSFLEFLQDVRTTSLEAFSHQDIPFEQLIEALQPERDRGHSPVFQVMFNFANAPGGNLEIPGLEISRFDFQQQTCRFDMTLTMSRQDGRLTGSWEYCRDLFRAETISRMVTHYQMLLEEVCSRPETSIRALTLDHEKDRCLMEAFHDRCGSERPDWDIMAHLHQQAAVHGAGPALIFGEETTLDYRTLMERVTGLAHGLADEIGCEDVVGIYMEPCMERIIAVLAVLHLGAVYLPLDPESPDARLAYMIDDAKPCLLLTLKTHQERLAAMSRTPVRVPATHGIPKQPFPPWIPRPEALAYIIYTSGSTGKPKGVMIPRAGLANMVFSVTKRYHVTHLARVFQFASFGFDSSVVEIFTTLAAGATLVLADRNQAMAGEDLFRFLNHHEITHITLTPSALALLPLEPLPHLDTLIVAGEACPQGLAAAWASRTRLINAYGPTEATVCVTAGRYEDPDEPLFLGHPLHQTRLSVSAPGGHPAPIGTVGQLLVSTPGLARGYLGRPKLTAAVFLPDPAGNGGRRYATGDLVRFGEWNGRPRLYFQGRVDDQVKLRGYRIEPGEIAAALMGHPQVAEAAVRLIQHGGAPHLAAYIRVQGEPQDADVFRRHLSGLLPRNMIPSYFICMERFPLTESGKLDHRRLPAPGEHTAKTISPRDELEEALAALWCRLLGLAAVGVQDDFFAVGGHSLAAVRLMEAVRRQWGQTLPLASFFANPCIEEMARALRSPVVQGESPLVHFQEGKGHLRLCLLHPIGGGVFCYRGLAEALGPDLGVSALQSPFLTSGLPASQLSTKAVLDTYLALIRPLAEQGPLVLAGWSTGGALAHELADALLQSGFNIPGVLLLDTQLPQGVPEDKVERLLVDFLSDLLRLKGRPPMPELLGRLLVRLRGKDDEQRWSVFMETVTGLGLDEEEPLLKRQWQVFSINHRVFSAFRPERLAAPVILLKAAQGESHAAPTWWQRVTVPGDHYSMLLGTSLSHLAQTISQLGLEMGTGDVPPLKAPP